MAKSITNVFIIFIITSTTRDVHMAECKMSWSLSTRGTDQRYIYIYSVLTGNPEVEGPFERPRRVRK